MAKAKAKGVAKTRTTAYDIVDQLRTPKEMAAYLDAWFEDAPDDAVGIARARRYCAGPRYDSGGAGCRIKPGKSLQGAWQRGESELCYYLESGARGWFEASCVGCMMRVVD